jgi:TP901 family phage tail tape measure protein
MATVANLSVVIGSDISGLQRGLNSAQNQVGGFGNTVSSKFKSVGESVGKLGADISGLSIPIGAALGYGIYTASQFETSMAEIGTRAGLTADEMDRVREYALRMGAETSFSAQEASDGLLQLMSSGQTLEESMKTLPAVMNLAAAGSISLAEAADTVTDVMSIYNMDVSEAATISDTLARAAGASSASVSDLQQAIANVGGVAATMGLDFETTIATLAVFAENGIKGAEAGTALKSLLLNMNSDTAAKAFQELGVRLYDTAGNTRDFETVIGELDTALDGLPVEEQNRLMQMLGGSYGIVGLTALRGSISIGEMEQRMDASAGAAEVAQGKMDTFAGKLDSLRGSVETLMIQAMTPFMERVLKPMIEEATKIANSFGDWAAKNPELATGLMTIGAVIAVAGPALMILSGIISGLGVALGLVLSPLGLFVIGIAGLAVIADDTMLKSGLKEIGDGIKKISEGNVGGGMSDVATGLAEIVAAVPVGGADIVLDFMSKITGVDFPSVREGLASWGPAFDNAGKIINYSLDNIKMGFARFVLEMQLKISEFIMNNQGIAQSLGINVDGVKFNTGFIKGALAALDYGPMVASEISSQIAGNEINLDEVVTFTSSDGTIVTGKISELLGDPNIVMAGGQRLKDNLSAALGMAFQQGSYDDLKTLIPLALELDIDTAAVREDVEFYLGAAIATGDKEAIELLTPLALELGIDIADLENQVNTAIQSGEYDTSTNATLTINWNVLNNMGDYTPPDVTGGYSTPIGPSVPPGYGGTDDTTDGGSGIVKTGSSTLPPINSGSTGPSGGNDLLGGGRSSGDIYNINSFGQDTRELVDMLERERSARSR